MKLFKVKQNPYLYNIGAMKTSFEKLIFRNEKKKTMGESTKFRCKGL